MITAKEGGKVEIRVTEEEGRGKQKSDRERKEGLKEERGRKGGRGGGQRKGRTDKDDRRMGEGSHKS